MRVSAQTDLLARVQLTPEFHHPPEIHHPRIAGQMEDGYRFKMGAAIDFAASLSAPHKRRRSMKLRTTSKVLRAFLIAAVLVMGLGSGALDKLDQSRTTSAWGCYEAMEAFHNAMISYEVARVSYFYDEPITCDAECTPPPPGQTHAYCVQECIQTRHTTMSSASITLTASALFTCTPEAPDGCAIARAMRDQCEALYDPGQYSEPAEALAVWSQLSACLEASKISYCE